MYLSARTQMLCDKYSFEQIVNIFKDAGYKGIEFCFENNHFEFMPYLLDKTILQHYSDLVKSSGMRISAAGCHINIIDNDINFNFVKKAVELCKYLDTDVFIVTAASPQKNIANNMRNTDIAETRLKILSEIGLKNNINIALEAEPNHIYNTSEQLNELIKKINMPNFGLNFDIGHSFLMDKNMFNAIELLKDRIFHTHIENMYRGQHLHLLPNMGDMDIDRIIDKLYNINYNGALSLDLYNYDYEKACKISADYLLPKLK